MRPVLLLLLAPLLSGCGDESEPRAIEAGDDPVRRHALAYDGDGYALVWTTGEERGTTDRLWFARFDHAGDVLVPPTPVLDYDLRVGELHLVAVPNGYLLWARQQTSGSGRVLAVPLDLTGDAMSMPADLGATRGAPDAIAAVWTGGGVAVLSSQLSSTMVPELHVGTFDTDLAPAVEQVLEPGQDQSEPYMVWSTSEQQALALWREPDRIQIARLGADGVLMAPSERLTEGDDPHRPCLAGDEVALLAGWSERGGYAPAFASALPGGAWMPQIGLIPSNRYRPAELAVAVRQGRALIAWTSDADTALAQVRVGRFTLPGGDAVEDVRQLTSERWNHEAPRLAAGRDGFAVAWRGTVDGTERLYFLTIAD